MSKTKSNTESIGVVINRIRIITEATGCTLFEALGLLSTQNDNRHYHDKRSIKYKTGYDDGWNDGARSVQRHYEQAQNDADD